MKNILQDSLSFLSILKTDWLQHYFNHPKGWRFQCFTAVATTRPDRRGQMPVLRTLKKSDTFQCIQYIEYSVQLLCLLIKQSWLATVYKNLSLAKVPSLQYNCLRMRKSVLSTKGWTLREAQLTVRGLWYLWIVFFSKVWEKTKKSRHDLMLSVCGFVGGSIQTKSLSIVSHLSNHKRMSW